MPKHWFQGFEFPSNGAFVALCSCGWRSEEHKVALDAARAHEEHVADDLGISVEELRTRAAKVLKGYL